MILNIFNEVEALTFEVLFHLWYQIRNEWWMWKNFPAAGVWEFHGCGMIVMSSIVMLKNSFGQQSKFLVPNSLFESLEVSWWAAAFTRCEINWKIFINITENKSHHSSYRLHSPGTITDASSLWGARWSILKQNCYRRWALSLPLYHREKTESAT